MRWPLLAAIPPLVSLVRARRRLGLPRALSQCLVPLAPAAVAAALPRSRPRHALLWAAQMWAYKVSFEIPYDRPERLRARLHVVQAPRLDARLGAGEVPSARLQRRWRSPKRVTALDRALALLYATWEVEPHLVLAWILRNHPERFARAAARLAATFDATLLGYWLLPSAPPWWASEEAGLMDGDVRRVITRVGRDLKGEPLEQDDTEGANPWAAMPSDHFASAVTAAIALGEASPLGGALAAAYAAALGFALVYLGEHYVVDLLAGLALAAAVHAAEPAVRPLARRADRAWRRLEPRRAPLRASRRPASHRRWRA